MFLYKADEAHSLGSWRICNLSFARNKKDVGAEGREERTNKLLRELCQASCGLQKACAQQALPLGRSGTDHPGKKAELIIAAAASLSPSRSTT